MRCAFRYVTESDQPLNSGRRRAKWVPPHIEGVLFAPAVAARVVARWHGGSHVLTLNGHYFAGGSPSMYGHLDSYSIVAYDESDHIIAFWNSA